MENHSVHSNDTEVLEDFPDWVPTAHSRNSEISSDFGRLIPINDSARHAFHELVALKSRDPSWAPHERNFIQEGAGRDSPGFFRFSLLLLPREFARGWVLGAGRADQPNSSVDLKLTDDGKRDRVRGRHAQIFHHPANALLMLTPGLEKAVVVNGREIRGHEKRVLPPDSCGIVIGNLACCFEFSTDVSVKLAYERQLRDLLKRKRQRFEDRELPELLDLTPSPTHYVLGKYQFQSPRAAGTYGVVSACIDRTTGDIFAAKRLQRRPETRLSILQELNILEKLGDHPHISSKVDTLFSDGDRSEMGHSRYNDVFIIMKPWAPLSLDELLRQRPHPVKSLSSETMLKISHQALQGSCFVHNHGIIHRDVKPANILLRGTPRIASDFRAILTDFGHATVKKDDRDHMKGTIAYLGPAIMQLKNAPGASRTTCFWSDKSDVWSLGPVIFQTVHSCNPEAFDSNCDAVRHSQVIEALKSSRR